MNAADIAYIQRAVFMADRFEAMMENEDPQSMPADLLLCQRSGSGSVYLGYSVRGDYWDDPTSINWEGFFESSDAFQQWWREREYRTRFEDFLNLPMEKKFKYWPM